ncbi:hypothetical protein [Nonomuraea sp. NPDC049646]|uniref:hypothetical protein n=1 Tax=unclassified Nonomuraea TaxID=2593643 RepID=UPI00378F16C2
MSERGEYLFLPGQQAIFEWKAERYLEQWIEIYKNSHRGEFDELDQNWKPTTERPVCRFAVWPAGSGMDLRTLVKIKIDENVVRPYWSGGISYDGKWVTRMSTRPAAHVYVTYEPQALPRNLEDLRRALKGVDIWTDQVKD